MVAMREGGLFWRSGWGGVADLVGGMERVRRVWSRCERGNNMI